MGNHGAPIMDGSAMFSFSDPSNNGAAVTSMCPGGTYGISIKFPNKRLAMLTATAGYLGSDKRCWNRLYSGDKALFDGFITKITVPCAAAGQPLIFKVTSAAGPKDAYHQATAQIPVALTGGPCTAIAAKAKCPIIQDPAAPDNATGPANLPGPAAKAASVEVINATGLPVGAPIVALTPGGPLTPDSAAAALTGATDLLADLGLGAGDALQVAPVIPGPGRRMWAYLHGALMMAAFALLLPVGSLLARHRWMFGRDPRTGKVLGSWLVVHVLVQLLAFLCASAGMVLVILGCGWKSMTSVPLYAPHKWMGVATFAATLLQLCGAALRPRAAAAAAGPAAAPAPPRGAWRALHGVLGRVAVFCGYCNVFMGALLMHGYKGQPHLYWLVPAAACTGAVVFLAILLEAIKLQMQRTHRYYPKTNGMVEVFDAHHRSSKRADSYGGSYGSETPSGSGSQADAESPGKGAAAGRFAAAPVPLGAAAWGATPAYPARDAPPAPSATALGGAAAYAGTGQARNTTPLAAPALAPVPAPAASSSAAAAAVPAATAATVGVATAAAAAAGAAADDAGPAASGSALRPPRERRHLEGAAANQRPLGGKEDEREAGQHKEAAAEVAAEAHEGTDEEQEQEEQEQEEEEQQEEEQQAEQEQGQEQQDESPAQPERATEQQPDQEQSGAKAPASPEA